MGKAKEGEWVRLSQFKSPLVGNRTLRRWASVGRFPAKLLGGNYFVHTADLEKFLRDTLGDTGVIVRK